MAHFIYSSIFSRNSTGPDLSHFLPSILKTHFQEKSLVPADSSPVILDMLELR